MYSSWEGEAKNSGWSSRTLGFHGPIFDSKSSIPFSTKKLASPSLADLQKVRLCQANSRGQQFYRKMQNHWHFEFPTLKETASLLFSSQVSNEEK